ncbi:MAG TPA: glycoside hydrolase family 88 protein [Terracidiphilus sp.]|nr:glycoside hydrolase family 88 protein [Terracidiphilus sp.]
MSTSHTFRNCVCASVVAVIAALFSISGIYALAQSKDLSVEIAQSAMQRWPEGHLSSSKPVYWHYQLGALLSGFDAVWYNTANPRYYHYVQNTIDTVIDKNGSIVAPSFVPRPLDQGLLGCQLLLLYGVTEQKNYYLAAKSIHDQLVAAMKDPSGQRQDSNFVSAAPFLAWYTSVFQQPQDFTLITRQFIRNEPKADNPLAVGPYLAALIDALPHYPAADPGRGQLRAILRHTASRIARMQAPKSGLWRQSLAPQSTVAGNIEPASTCLLTYALAKAVRLGYLPRSFMRRTARAWEGIQQLILPSIGVSDPRIVGTFLLTAAEMENQRAGLDSLGKTILLDAWYNSQTRTNAAGQTELFHYKWDDRSNSGFWLLGHMFRNRGVRTETLTTAPTAANLKGADFYLIVSPDNTAKNPHPNYMTEADAAQVARWVHHGGVLILMENDRDNADIPHLDLLADKFGLHFNNVLTHHVVGSQHEMGKMLLTKPEGFFTQPHQLFMKDTCSLTLSGNARPLLTWKGDILMATAHYGKGTVVAVADPWLYNEYTDGRNLEAGYDNFAGGQEFVRWLLQQP